MQTPKLIILGRDGILNRFREDHVKEPAEWEPIPGALEAVAKLNHAGWHVVVATNQAGIGRGMIDMAAVNAVHLYMMKMLATKGGRLDAVFFCPHTRDDHCDCRKPMPGMNVVLRLTVSNSGTCTESLCQILTQRNTPACRSTLHNAPTSQSRNSHTVSSILGAISSRLPASARSCVTVCWVSRRCSARLRSVISCTEPNIRRGRPYSSRTTSP